VKEIVASRTRVPANLNRLQVAADSLRRFNLQARPSQRDDHHEFSPTNSPLLA
jgi:hypothetical protein